MGACASFPKSVLRSESGTKPQEEEEGAEEQQVQKKGGDEGGEEGEEQQNSLGSFLAEQGMKAVGLSSEEAKEEKEDEGAKGEDENKVQAAVLAGAKVLAGVEDEKREHEDKE